METVAMISVLPFMLLLSIPIGLFHFFTIFGFLYGLPVIVISVGAFIANKYKKTKTALLLISTAAIGQLFSFLSWLVSRHSINAGESTHQWAMNLPSIAEAGFPISALELPPPPMGNDNIPTDMWGGVFINHLFWFAIAFFFAVLIILKIKNHNKKLLTIGILIAVFALVYNLALFTFWYD